MLFDPYLEQQLAAKAAIFEDALSRVLRSAHSRGCAGISGLTCAYALKKSGENVLMLEAGEWAGGVYRIRRENGFLFEKGPGRVFMAPSRSQLCDELGISRLKHQNVFNGFFERA